jgi:hypothetical protein
LPQNVVHLGPDGTENKYARHKWYVKFATQPGVAEVASLEVLKTISIGFRSFENVHIKYDGDESRKDE